MLKQKLQLIVFFYTASLKETICKSAEEPTTEVRISTSSIIDGEGFKINAILEGWVSAPALWRLAVERKREGDHSTWLRHSKDRCHYR
jgi:hypothetical protein